MHLFPIHAQETQPNWSNWCCLITFVEGPWMTWECIADWSLLSLFTALMEPVRYVSVMKYVVVLEKDFKIDQANSPNVSGYDVNDWNRAFPSMTLTLFALNFDPCDSLILCSSSLCMRLLVCFHELTITCWKCPWYWIKGWAITMAMHMLQVTQSVIMGIIMAACIKKNSQIIDRQKNNIRVVFL